MACVGAISEERGKEHFEFVERAFNSKQFLDFLKYLLIQKPEERSLALVLDNASIHKTKSVKDWARENDVNIIYNVPYAPWFNGIEEFWAEAKGVFRNMGTKALLKTGSRDIWEEAHAATLAVVDEHAKKYARRGLEAIQNIQLPHVEMASAGIL